MPSLLVNARSGLSKGSPIHLNMNKRRGSSRLLAPR
jgi:hypothetical protein